MRSGQEIPKSEVQRRRKIADMPQEVKDIAKRCGFASDAKAMLELLAAYESDGEAGANKVAPAIKARLTKAKARKPKDKARAKPQKAAPAPTEEAPVPAAEATTAPAAEEPTPSEPAAAVSEPTSPEPSSASPEPAKEIPEPAPAVPDYKALPDGARDIVDSWNDATERDRNKALAFLGLRRI